jgi:hypothetical protein
MMVNRSALGSNVMGTSNVSRKTLFAIFASIRPSGGSLAAPDEPKARREHSQ